jgi:hypothetical protein
MTQTVSGTSSELAPFVMQYQMDEHTELAALIDVANTTQQWEHSQVGINSKHGMTEREETERQSARSSSQVSLATLNFSQQQIDALPALTFAAACLFDYLLAFPEASLGYPEFVVREAPEILRYEIGEAYAQPHADSHPHAFPNRHLTFCLYLNTVEKGGELCFVRQGVEVKPVKGTAVIFPSGWTHSHYTKPTESTRYVFQLWWSFINGAPGCP